MIDEIFEKFDGAFTENTLRAYRSDFQQYEAWCATNKQPSLPATAELIAEYLDFMATENRSATIRRRINSLGTIFKLSKHPDPTKGLKLYWRSSECTAKLAVAKNRRPPHKGHPGETSGAMR